jgi:hypothetical protein
VKKRRNTKKIKDKKEIAKKIMCTKIRGAGQKTNMAKDKERKDKKIRKRRL